MSFRENILDTSQLRLHGSFDDQVLQLLQEIRLTRTEVENLSYLFKDLEASLHYAWPGCTAHAFGSIVTGLGIKTSDIDCYIQMPPNIDVNAKTFVNKASKLLKYRRNIFYEVFAISAAKVPILKFFHAPTRFHCDVSFTSSHGICNSKLICYLMQLDKRALQIAILVKYWSKLFNLAGTNLLPNYALIMLVIFYLQTVNILPSVSQLQKLVKPHIIDKWNYGFDGYQHTNENQSSVHDLIGGFFLYYSEFDFQTFIISPFLGYPIKREVFKEISTIPDEFTLYKDNILNGTCQPLQIKDDKMFCIQDPFMHNRNCAVAVYSKLATKLLIYFQFVTEVFNSSSSDNFLTAFLSRQPKGVVEAAGKKARKKPVSYKNKPIQHNKVTKRSFNWRNIASKGEVIKKHL